jgi:glucosamine-6-phosphate deaminase
VKWEVVEDYGTMSRKAASLLLTALRENPETSFGLPTGKTPEGMYSQIVAECGRTYHCFSRATTFNLDEYAGVPREHPGSYYTYMRMRLFRHVDLDPLRVHIPHGMAEDPDEECERYERKILAAGGLDLTFLGLGTNGHIGFNEPGSPLHSRTRVVTLSESTRRANAPYFPDGDVPHQALTMGIGTILESRTIYLLASGEKKAEAIRRLARDEPDVEFPASALLRHPNVTVIADRAAAQAV